MVAHIARRFIIPSLVVAVLGGASAIHAVAKDDDKDCKRSQDCARDSFQSGEIRPLAEVLAAVRERVPGEVVKIELERDDGVWMYEVKVLTPNGRRREVEINAKTLVIEKID